MDLHKIDTAFGSLASLLESGYIPNMLLKKLPKIGATKGVDPADVKVPVKIMDPEGRDTWYVVEYNPTSNEAFGWIAVGRPKLGSFNLQDIFQDKKRQGFIKSRLTTDNWWDPNTSLKDVMSGAVS